MVQYNIGCNLKFNNKGQKYYTKDNLLKKVELLEDEKIQKILNGLNLNIEYSKHPTHRWIIENNNKIYTSGIFMYLKCK